MPPLEPPPASASASKAMATTATPGVSVAPIDRDTLSTVLKPAMKADWGIASTMTSITAAGAMAQYIVGQAQTLAAKLTGSAPTDMLDDYYLLTIRVGGSATTLMSGHVEGFGGANPVPVTGLQKPLGDSALRTPFSVFWTRGDSLFVDILHCVDKVFPAERGASATDALLPLATALDAHLAANWAADTSKVRPKATLATPTPVKAKAGSVFTIQLNLGTAAATHSLKSADDVGSRVGGSAIAIQTENGSVNGLFSFLAARTGSSRVRMRVADSKTLAITEVEAAVEVA